MARMVADDDFAVEICIFAMLGKETKCIGLTI